MLWYAGPYVRHSVPARLIFLGIVAILFLHCLSALLYPAGHTKGGIKWGLVAHTSAMFSFATIAVGLGIDLQSISYIEDRDFPGFYNGEAPGPLGYQLLVYSKAINVVPNLMFILNQLLADGLLVSFVFSTVCLASNMDPSSSSIVAMLFTP
jgi:hypothetical protein